MLIPQILTISVLDVFTVAFARMFFPTEAKLAMEIAHAEATSGFAGLLSSRGSSGNLMEVDLNETPITQNKRLLARIETLSRTGIFTFKWEYFI